MIFLVSILMGALYCGLIIFLFLAWEEIPTEIIPTDFHPDLFISIIVVGRNETENIESCLRSILDNNLSNSAFEIIFIDDHSTDNTVQKVQSIASPNITVLQLSHFLDKKINAFKKAAIQIGINKSKGELLMFTDADCIVPNDWIQRTAFNFQSKDLVFQTASVTFSPIYKFLHWFQELDIIAMMATTNAGIRKSKWYLANGANLSFLKSKLPDNYFAEANELASGDDVFLVNTFAKAHPDKIYFEKQITVKTKPVNKRSDFFQQRIRWAGKNRILAKGKMSKALIIPLVFYLWCLLLLGFLICGQTTAGWLLLCLLLIKVLMDHALLQFVYKDLSNYPKMKFFFSSSLLYPFYFLGIGLWSLFQTKYQWKGRTVK